VLRTFAHTTDDNFPFQVRSPRVSRQPSLGAPTEACLWHDSGHAPNEPTIWLPGVASAAIDKFGQMGFGRVCYLLPSVTICCNRQESPGVFNEVTFRALDWLLDEARCCQPFPVPPSSGRCILGTCYVFGNSGPITCSSVMVSQSSDAQFCDVSSIGMGLLAQPCP